MKFFRKILILMVLAMPLTMATPNLATAQSFGQKIILVDFARVSNESFLGQDVQAQLQSYGELMNGIKIALENTLTAERDDLANKEKIMAPADFGQLVTEWETKAANAQSQIEGMRQRLLKAGQAAEQEMTRHLRPIILRLMQEKGGDLVIDKGYIYTNKAGFDITGEVIAALNAASTSFDLRLTQ